MTTTYPSSPSSSSSSSSSPAPFAVIGATGQQGAATIDALLAQDAAVRALVRDPNAEAASALQDRGVKIVAADQEDGAALEAGLAGAAALFFFTTFGGPDGTDGEVRRGTTIAEAAARAGVPRVVYSSVGGAERGTHIPHFESKRRVEQRLEELLPATFLRPTFFMENLAAQLPAGGEGDSAGEFVLRLPVPGDVPLQMVSVRDIGRAAARLLLDPDAVAGNAVEIAGDELTMDQVAVAIGDAYDVDARFDALPLEVLAADPDLQAMFGWFATTSPSYRADRDATRALVPDALDLPAWLSVQRRLAASPASR